MRTYVDVTGEPVTPGTIESLASGDGWRDAHADPDSYDEARNRAEHRDTVRGFILITPAA